MKRDIGRAAARCNAPKQPRAIRVGPHSGGLSTQTKKWGPNTGGLSDFLTRYRGFIGTIWHTGGLSSLSDFTLTFRGFSLDISR